MTSHSGHGQGDQPPYEGVVLPSSGEPLTPGQPRQPDSPQPAQGQPWGQPWGPADEPAAPPGAPSTPGQPPAGPPSYGGHGPQGAGAPDAGPYGTGAHSMGAPGMGGAPSYPGQPAHFGQQQPGQPGAGPLPSGVPAPPPLPPTAPPTPPPGQLPPHVGDSEATQLLPPIPSGDGADGAYGMDGTAESPAESTQKLSAIRPPRAPGAHRRAPRTDEPPGAEPPPAVPPGPQPGMWPTGGTGQSLPQDAFTEQLRPQPAPPRPPHAGHPLPSGPPQPGDPDAESTQLIPPFSAAAHGGLPGQPGSPGSPESAAEATQLLPPQPGNAGPDATAMLRSPLPPEAGPPGGPPPQPGAAPPPPPGAPYGIRAGAPEDRQPLAEFDSLFRAEPAPGQPHQPQQHGQPHQPGRHGRSAPPPPADSGDPGSTQALPLFDHAAAQQQHEHQQQHHQQSPYPGPQQGGGAPYEPQGRAARRTAERGGRGRGPMSPPVLIGAGVAGIIVIGLLVGAALSGGGGGGDDKDSSKDAAPASSPPPAKKSPAPVTAETQATKLDKLLESSNNSRTSVINAVENIKQCKKLGAAASDLRAAAEQRQGLVTRLGKLELGKVPENAQLNASLTRAWRASAKADRAYAAWADQVAAKKGCPKGKARHTDQQVAGTRASGEATSAKKEAARLWNPTAKKYGLTERQFSQL